MQVKLVLSLVAVLPKVHHLPEKVNKPLMLGYTGTDNPVNHNRDLLLWLTGGLIPTMDQRTNGRFSSIRALSVKMKLTGCQYETGGSQWSIFCTASRSRFAEQAERLHILMISGWMKWKQEYHLDMQVFRQSPDKVGSDGLGRKRRKSHESNNRLSDLYRQHCR